MRNHEISVHFVCKAVQMLWRFIGVVVFAPKVIASISLPLEAVSLLQRFEWAVHPVHICRLKVSCGMRSTQVNEHCSCPRRVRSFHLLVFASGQGGRQTWSLFNWHCQRLYCNQLAPTPTVRTFGCNADGNYADSHYELWQDICARMLRRWQRTRTFVNKHAFIAFLAFRYSDF